MPAGRKGHRAEVTARPRGRSGVRAAEVRAGGALRPLSILRGSGAGRLRRGPRRAPAGVPGGGSEEEADEARLDRRPCRRAARSLAPAAARRFAVPAERGPGPEEEPVLPPIPWPGPEGSRRASAAGSDVARRRMTDRVRCRSAVAGSRLGERRHPGNRMGVRGGTDGCLDTMHHREEEDVSRPADIASAGCSCRSAGR